MKSWADILVTTVTSWGNMQGDSRCESPFEEEILSVMRKRFRY